MLSSSSPARCSVAEAPPASSLPPLGQGTLLIVPRSYGTCYLEQRGARLLFSFLAVCVSPCSSPARRRFALPPPVRSPPWGPRGYCGPIHALGSRHRGRSRRRQAREASRHFVGREVLCRFSLGQRFGINVLIISH